MPAEFSIKLLAERVRRLRGWRRRGAALAAGAVSVLAMAPCRAWPVLWIGLPVLVWLIDGATCRAAPSHAAKREGLRRRAPDLLRWHERPPIAPAAVGWWLGFGYFVPGL